MRTRARHMGCSAAAFVAVAFTAAISIPPASVQAADAQAQIDSFAFAPQRLDGEVVYIKVDQIVFVMSAKDTGAAERARSKVQLLNGHSDVRESVEEVMRTIENDGLFAKDGT